MYHNKFVSANDIDGAGEATNGRIIGFRTGIWWYSRFIRRLPAGIS